MYLAKALTVLALCAWVAAASSDCNDLVRYLKPEDINLIFGKWTVAIAASDETLHNTLQQLTSSWYEVASSPDSGVVYYNWRDRMDGVCTYGSANATVNGDNIVLSVNSQEYKGQYLYTCPGCQLGVTHAELNGVSGRYFILAKQGESLTDSERQTFEKQAACLNFPPIYFTFTDASKLCPEQGQPALSSR